MDHIELRGLTFYGFHGALPEERTLGQRFVVDLRLGLDLKPAGRSDNLSLTANYAEVAATVRAVVEGEPVNLVEALAERIATRVLDAHSRVMQVEVRVEKPSAPIQASPSGTVAVEIVRDRIAPRAEVQISNRAPDAARCGSVLSAATIRELCRAEPPLVGGMDDADLQIQPNGVDLTLDGVWELAGAGALGWSNADRVLAPRRPLSESGDGWYRLEPGAYLVRLREVVSLPLDIMAFGRPRSSLARCGASLHTAVWDAGYAGRSESLLVVHGQEALRLRPAARILQLVFFRLDAPTTAYSGAYQRENLA